MTDQDAPMTDAEILALGWKPTPQGWLPLRGQRIPDTPELLGAIANARTDYRLPEPIAELDAIRSSARRVMEDDTLTEDEENSAILGLLRATEETTLPEWAREVILREYLGPPEPLPGPSMKRIDAWEGLQRAGFSECPVCFAPQLLPSPPPEIDFDGWKLLTPEERGRRAELEHRRRVVATFWRNRQRANTDAAEAWEKAVQS